MKTLTEIRDGRFSLEDLQAQKNLRDAEVQRLRDEMAGIHALMEPQWAAQERATAGPANLRQRVM